MKSPLMKIAKKHPAVYKELANLYIESGELRKAKKALANYIKAFPDDHSGLIVKGFLEEKLMHYDASEKIYRIILNANPGNIRALSRLVNLENMKKNPSDFWKKRLFRVDPLSPLVRDMLDKSAPKPPPPTPKPPPSAKPQEGKIDAVEELLVEPAVEAEQDQLESKKEVSWDRLQQKPQDKVKALDDLQEEEGGKDEELLSALAKQFDLDETEAEEVGLIFSEENGSKKTGDEISVTPSVPDAKGKPAEFETLPEPEKEEVVDNVDEVDASGSLIFDTREGGELDNLIKNSGNGEEVSEIGDIDTAAEKISLDKEKSEIAAEESEYGDLDTLIQELSSEKDDADMQKVNDSPENLVEELEKTEASETSVSFDEGDLESIDSLLEELGTQEKTEKAAAETESEIEDMDTEEPTEAEEPADTAVADGDQDSIDALISQVAEKSEEIVHEESKEDFDLESVVKETQALDEPEEDSIDALIEQLNSDIDETDKQIAESDVSEGGEEYEEKGQDPIDALIASMNGEESDTDITEAEEKSISEEAEEVEIFEEGGQDSTDELVEQRSAEEVGTFEREDVKEAEEEVEEEDSDEEESQKFKISERDSIEEMVAEMSDQPEAEEEAPAAKVVLLDPETGLPVEDDEEPVELGTPTDEPEVATEEISEPEPLATAPADAEPVAIEKPEPSETVPVEEELVAIEKSEPETDAEELIEDEEEPSSPPVSEEKVEELMTAFREIDDDVDEKPKEQPKKKIYSTTLAELFASQGNYEKALNLYNSFPEDVKAQHIDRIKELEQKIKDK